ncbi:MAG: hypothetical protein IJT51_08260 [Bacteroidales bacterium]|nr:hypothetical protein [Bacteroidales bacterium]
MKRGNKLFVLLLVVVMLCGCAAKKLVKKAFEYEISGFKSEALELYCEALEKDDENIDAKLGVKRLGQEQLDAKLAAFKEAYTKGENLAAQNLYQTALAYYNKIHNRGVQLEFPSYYKNYYDEVKAAYIEERYYKACSLLEAKNYAAAESIFKEINAQYPNYKDVKQRLREAVNEPVYRRGVAQLGSQKYKEAYDTFSEISNYKDAATLRIEAKDAYIDEQYAAGCQYLEADRFNMAETAFRNILALTSNYKDVKQKLREATDEPFYRQGTLSLKSRKYKEAYDNFSKISGYKDATELCSESKKLYVEEQYAAGCKYFDTDRFSMAETAFRNVIAFNPNYKDASARLNASIWEPKYRSINSLMQNRKYRSAYDLCVTMRRNYGEYKNSEMLTNECQERGTVIMVVPKISNPSDPVFAQSFQAEVIRQVQNLNNQFLKITDQRPTAHTKSQIVYLECAFQTFRYIPGSLKKYTKQGWLYRGKKKNILGEVVDDWEKVEYYEYEQSRSLDLNIRYRIYNYKNNAVLKEGAKLFQSSDYVHYAKYLNGSGNSENLYPGYWKHKGILSVFNNKEDYIDYDNYKNLQNLLKGRTELKSYNAMLAEVQYPAIPIIVDAVRNYMLNE